jgi:hypothetical protein
VLSDDANQYVCADAVKFLRDGGGVPAEEIVVDNTQASTVGSWPTGAWNDIGRFWGATIAYNVAGTGAETMTWSPVLPAAGR